MFLLTNLIVVLFQVLSVLFSDKILNFSYELYRMCALCGEFCVLLLRYWKSIKIVDIRLFHFCVANENVSVYCEFLFNQSFEIWIKDINDISIFSDNHIMIVKHSISDDHRNDVDHRTVFERSNIARYSLTIEKLL